MSNVVSVRPDGHDRFGERVQQTPISDELNTIMGVLRDALPHQAIVSFDFQRQLYVHIDVPRREDVILIEAQLPKAGQGLVRDIRRAATPRRPFWHRVSAVVNS